MKLGVSMWSYYRVWKQGGFSIADFIHEANRVGAAGVELLDFFYGSEPIEPEMNDALSALKSTGLPCGVFSVAQNFARTEPGERAQELDKIRFGIEQAHIFGAKVVRVFAGDVAPGITFEEARDWIVEGLVKASLEAAQAGVKLGLENHGTLAGTGDQVARIIEDVRAASGTDALGSNPDTGNFHLIDPPSEVAVAKVAKYATMVHFKDFRHARDSSEGFEYGPKNERFVGTALGDGEVNLAACIGELKAAGFDGWVNLEYEGEEDPMRAVPRSIAFAKGLLG